MLNFFGKWRGHACLRRPDGGSLGFRVASEVKASRHDDGLVLIHHGKGIVFSANRVGAMIWNAAVERLSLDQLSASISREFQISLDEARQDIVEFLAQLAAEGLLVADGS